MLFYRDGISESQFKQCIEDEISTIKDAYRTMCKQEVNLTFVICGKRHHTRFYAVEKSQTYPLKTSDPTKLNGNLKPGLLVTKVVTNPTPFNFFLQSHLALKGTARSAHYHVLEDGMNIGKKKLPELTMMLCYAFGRSTTGVSYAAPAYIADRLCERGRVYLRAWNLDPDMEPKFVMPEETDDNGKHIRVGETEIKEAKTAFAKEISEQMRCGVTFTTPRLSKRTPSFTASCGSIPGILYSTRGTACSGCKRACLAVDGGGGPDW
jgi:eukaryotic translation initiation factor 2C